ncbi:MAG: hypothetical protein HYW80_01075 [Parcubacteria group bacterium]|nr:hypothetical protein [Parcubacteria group bacterium]
MRVLLIDVFALLHRAYHALPKLTTDSGEPIGGVYGFTTLLLKAQKELRPDVVLAAVDLPEPTFRHKEFPGYQATRPETPSDFVPQIAKVKELLETFQIPVFAMAGYEADDVIGSLVRQLKSREGVEVIVLTGDLDSLQLVNDKTKIYTLRKGLTDTLIYDQAAFESRFGFRPDLLPDYKGLVGDTSDNIPGVSGVGPKTAQKLIAEFGALENIYRAVVAKDSRIAAPLQEKLLRAKSQALLSKYLATIRQDLLLSEKELLGGRTPNAPTQAARDLFLRWGFRALLSRLEKQGELQFGKTNEER